MKHIGKALGISVGLLGGVLAAFFLYSSTHKSDFYIQAFSKNEFLLEGELYFRGSNGREWHDYVVEYHAGGNYEIKYSEWSYFFINGQYYVEDDNGMVLVSTPENELRQIEEMFARASVISNYDFSNLKFRTKSSEEMVELSTGEPILVDYEEYELEGTENIVRMYFVRNFKLEKS